MGMLIWQDFVNPPHHLPEEAKPIFEKETKETIEQLYNHPSIVTWVLFNEQWGSYDQKRLTEWVKAADPSRIVDGHTGEYIYIDEQMTKEGHDNWVSSDMTDIHSYPNPMNPTKQPGKAMVLGEFGGTGVSVPGHQWNDLQGWGYIQATPSELIGKYEIMTKRLKKLEAEGLTASIYTQPFDVEGEENGLLTYDRNVIKIPVTSLREINQIMVPETKGFALNPKFRIAQNVDTNDTDKRYAEFLQQYEKGKRDSAFLRRLTLMAIRQKDQPKATQIGNDYISGLKQLYLKESLTFIQQITRTSKDSGFELFRTQSEKVNIVLGDHVADRKVKDIIYAEEIEPYTTGKDTKPDWDVIQQRIISKYGSLGEEFVLGQRMLYYVSTTQDWKNFGKYYVLYYEKALTHSEFHINNVSWVVFEHVDDPKVLTFAEKVSKYNVEKLDQTSEAIDTYANLLHKLGKTEEAIEWEKKAIKLSNNEEVFVKTLEKMKEGRPTWPIPGSTN
jgi:hypothetical protein